MQCIYKYTHKHFNSGIAIYIMNRKYFNNNIILKREYAI